MNDKPPLLPVVMKTVIYPGSSFTILIQGERAYYMNCKSPTTENIIKYTHEKTFKNTLNLSNPQIMPEGVNKGID